MPNRRFSRRALLGALGAAAAATAGCTAPAEAPGPPSQSTESGHEISLSSDASWTTYGYTPAHTGHNSNASGVVGDPTKVWEGFVDGIYTLREPAVADGRLFVLIVDDIVAYDDTGDEDWRATSDCTQLTRMAVGGERLYVGSEQLFALNAETGEVQFELTENVFHLTYGAPIVVDDVLYAGICIKDEAGAMYDNSVRAFV
ncbi:outer membrane protein assembly factor BamB family protein [Halobacterium sp. KA-6]|uniref:outer membrane protein assembly factor BamB family protein n=1 Tax=Halobacterium sp. KA-6 TaxID=2896368 RepID=UPI001E315592|nr:PQQ-binding-like beta-propeller repeat protein [Halobacterium sp. KA-6]MCD2203137.1 PQQ-binding-like beta-propeller repeat protein [Halobacterium sp. KA-6]